MSKGLQEAGLFRIPSEGAVAEAVSRCDYIILKKKEERKDELECLQAIKKGKVLKEIATLYNFDNYRRAEDPLTIYLYEDKFYQINYGTTKIRGDSSVPTLRVRCLIDDNFAN